MKKWKKIVLWIVAIPVLAFIFICLFLMMKKDSITEDLIQEYNSSIQGEISLASSQISPFKNFPYISIDLQDLKIYESKNTNEAFISLKDVYVGFDILTIVKGDFQIKRISAEDGEINIIQNIDESYNIVSAFESLAENDEVTKEASSYFLDKIQLENIQLSKFNEKDSLKISSQIETAKGTIQSVNNELDIHIDTSLFLSVITGVDTSFVNHKYMELHTDFMYDLEKSNIDFKESELMLDQGVFAMNGTIDLAKDVDLDLEFKGLKKNFDLFIAFAPTEIEEALKVYENQGDVFFEAQIKGKSINGFSPLVEARFGCENGFFDNIQEDKKLSNLNFAGTFTNGKDRNIKTSELQIQNFSASPEAGIFNGNLHIINFETPEIDLQLDSDFDLNFLTRFFNISTLKDLTGQVKLKMNFRDIIDLENPGVALEEFNQSYYSELEIKNLNFTTDAYHLPINNLNLKAKMEGNLTTIDLFTLRIGQSDFSLQGDLKGLPDLVHQTNKEVEVNVKLVSKLIDFTEMTRISKEGAARFDDQVTNFTTKLKFKGAANTFQVSDTLPLGTFYVEELFGKFKNYPHELHDFFARIYIRKNEVEVIDFNGMVDDSDFHFTGKLDNYNVLLQENPKGDVLFSFDVDSEVIRLKDVFSYNNENYVPEEYREEVLREIKGNGTLALHFQDSLIASDFNLGFFKGRMHIHPLKFEDFKGRLHFENDQLSFEDFEGKIGKSHFSVSGNYYLGEDQTLLQEGDVINFKAAYLDMDELSNYREPNPSETKAIDHDEAFNIFEVPFRNMKINATIGKLNYHKYQLENFTSQVRMQDNHYLYVDDMRFEAAGGKVALTGYFNGSNPDSIYMHPDLKLQDVDLDQLLFKFDNFGQDQMVSENLHGIMKGRIKGKVLLHTDLTPYVEKSNLNIDVSIQNGSLENFEPMQALSDFFDDKNLNRVFFGSLENRLQLKDGSLIIPNMLINSSLGFMELSGKQSVTMDMDYYMRIPLKMVTQVAANKLFGGKSETVDAKQEDGIIYKDETQNTKYVNLRMNGKPEDYTISLRKNRDKEKGAKAFEKEGDFLFENISIDKFSWNTNP